MIFLYTACLEKIIFYFLENIIKNNAYILSSEKKCTLSSLKISNFRKELTGNIWNSHFDIQVVIIQRDR